MEELEAKVRIRDLRWLSKAAEQDRELVISAAVAMAQSCDEKDVECHGRT